MVEKTERTEKQTGSRSADGRRFEVFVRENEPDPLRHVGTVAAPTPDTAHEEASKLFAWYARDVWICPAAETHRYSAESLAGEPAADGTDPNASERADGEGSRDEPRVYEETEGTPTVGCGRVPIDNGDGEVDAAGDGVTKDGTDGVTEDGIDRVTEDGTDGGSGR